MRALSVIALLAVVGCGQRPSAPLPAQSKQEPTASTLAPAQAASASPILTTEPLRVGNGVTEPVELSRVKPDYSHIKNLRIGMAMLEATITSQGNVENVRVLRSHSPEVDAALLAAIKQWRYRPATFKGKPVAVYLTITANLCG